MGKRGGNKKGLEGTSAKYTPMSIREEVSGRKQTNNLKSLMKLKHLENLAVWAGGKASIPSLGALFGRQFAATGEALGIAPDASLFTCQRCETILQPGFNCTIRVVKNRAKNQRQRKKPVSVAQNNVVYNCHLCSYENIKRGTPKGHMKEICPPKPKPKPAESAHKNQVATSEQGTVNKLETEKTEEETSSVAENPPTPTASKSLSLLDSKKRKRNKAKPKKPEANNAAMTDAKSKRRKKGWTTLREIAESNAMEKRKSFTSFSIPFTL